MGEASQRAGGRTPKSILGRLLGSSHLRSHFGGKVVCLLLDAFAHHVQGKALTRGAGGLEHLLHCLLVVFDEGLVEQATPL